MKQIIEKNIKVVTNAGGMNPLALKLAIEKVNKSAGIDIKVGAVVGDDLMEMMDSIGDDIVQFEIEGEVEKLPTDKMMISCNAYLGAFPVADALDKGAQVVVTGRSVDSAVVLGPLIHEFGWRKQDYRLLAWYLLRCD